MSIDEWGNTVFFLCISKGHGSQIAAADKRSIDITPATVVSLTSLYVE